MSLSAKMPLYAAAILAFSAAPSFAAMVHKVTNEGTFSMSSDSKGFENSGLVGKFKDYVYFTIVPTTTDISATITNTYTFRSQGANIKGLVLSLYSGTLNQSQASLDANGGGTFILSSPTATNTPPTSTTPGQEMGGFAYTFTTPGDYYIQIAADPGSSTRASYGGSINYALTPLPSTLPMLAGAVLAIAAGGHVMSRRRFAKTATA